MVRPIAVIPKAKEKNYTEKMEQEMERRYLAAPTRETADQIAKDFGKAERSVISKLSNMGIYIVPKRTTKAGTPIVKKSELVNSIGALLEVEVPSLEKSNKQDLVKLLAAVEEWTGSIEDGAHLVT
jgi:hypothetical protein